MFYRSGWLRCVGFICVGSCFKYVVFMILCFVLEKGYWFYVWIGAGERYRDLSEWMVICDLLIFLFLSYLNGIV